MELSGFIFLYSCLCAVYVMNITSAASACPNPCFCSFNKKSATCNSRRLRYIPKLPSYVKTVKFIGNHFARIDRQFFGNLTKYNKIRTLNMTDNLIQTISNDSFADFVYLTSLEVSKESNLNKMMLKDSLHSLPVNQMSFLQFSGNAWQTIPLDMFLSFADNTVKYFNISLTHNRLQYIDSRMFQPIKNLAKLNLGWNELDNFTFNSVLNVKELNLNGNSIHDIPSWCGSDNKTLVPNLRVLRLDDNSISKMNQASFQCIRSVERLGLSANNFRKLRNNTFSDLQSLTTLSISENIKLRQIEDFAFNISSLRSLNFSQNNFQFNKGVYQSSNPDQLFKHCKNLEFLYISHNTIPTYGQYTIFRAIFRPLTKLKVLDLESCSIRSLPYHTLANMKQLEFLNLNKNLLQGWGKSNLVFGTKSSLKVLTLRSNFIRLVNETTFPPSLLSSLRKLDLSDNYFSCTCDQMWFRDWIRQNIESRTRKIDLVLAGYPRFYRCKLPGERRGLSLKDYNPTVENCKETNPLIIVAIAVSSVVVIALLIITALYKCQTNIKNYIYLCRFYKNRKSGYIQLDNKEDYEYHAFIVYCDEDRDWVHNHCVKRLENEEGMKVCFHHRDFEIGEPVTGNIEKYMSKCRKIIVVMSNSFAESQWCQWEIDLVHERRRKQGKDVSLLIMLKTIDSKHMTSRLKALLESTPYLTYCTGVGERIFWKTLVKSLRKPFGHPPFAVV